MQRDRDDPTLGRQTYLVINPFTIAIMVGNRTVFPRTPAVPVYVTPSEAAALKLAGWTVDPQDETDANAAVGLVDTAHPVTEALAQPKRLDFAVVPAAGQAVFGLPRPPRDVNLVYFTVNGDQYRGPQIKVDSVSLTWDNELFALSSDDACYICNL